MSPPSLWSRVPALFALAVVPLALAGACAGGAGDAADEASSGPPRYAGALSCLDCAAIDTRVTLFAGDSFLLEETYRATRDGDRTYRSRGTWASLGDAANPAAGRILMLSPNAGETRRFRMLGDTALRQLDRTGNELKTKANTLLKREP